MLNTEKIRDFPVTSKDSRRATHVHGKNRISLRGKYAKRFKTKNPAPTIINTSKDIIDKILSVRLYVDIMRLNGNKFLHAMSDNIRLRTATCIQSRTKPFILKGLQDVIITPKKGGFVVKYIDADMEFECSENIIDQVTVDIVAEDEHESAVERSILTIEDRMSCMVQNMPCRCLTLLMVNQLVQVSIRNINQFPVKIVFPKHIAHLT